MPQAEDRPKNREVEDEMIRIPEKEGRPPRPATEPKDGDLRKETPAKQ